MAIKKVLITGGTGYIGKWMQLTKPDDVYIYMFLSKEGYDSTRWEHGDWTHIVHLAPVAPTRVLEYARIFKSRVLFASSGAVYNHTNEYADNKRKWEMECLGDDVDVVIARLFTFIGPYLRGRFAVKNFVEAAREGKPLEVWGDGSTVRSYLHGIDAGQWMWKLLFEGQGVYDVGSQFPTTILELAQMIARRVRVPIHILNNEYKETIYLPTKDDMSLLGCRQTIHIGKAIDDYLESNE